MWWICQLFVLISFYNLGFILSVQLCHSFIYFLRLRLLMDGGSKAILHFIFFRKGGGSRSKISWDSGVSEILSYRETNTRLCLCFLFKDNSYKFMILPPPCSEQVWILVWLFWDFHEISICKNAYGFFINPTNNLLLWC